MPFGVRGVRPMSKTEKTKMKKQTSPMPFGVRGVRPTLLKVGACQRKPLVSNAFRREGRSPQAGIIWKYDITPKCLQCLSA